MPEVGVVQPVAEDLQRLAAANLFAVGRVTFEEPPGHLSSLLWAGRSKTTY
jgi:hypothetical protein